MTGKEKPEGRLSFLKVFHAFVFLLLSAAAMGLGQEEAKQLLFAVSKPYHFGAPPSVLPLLGALCGAVCAALLLFHFVRLKTTPLWVSALAVAGVLIGYFGRTDGTEVRRNHHAANLDVMAAARQLHRARVDELQRTAELPRDQASWAKALEALSLPKSPARTRSFSLLPFEIAMLASNDASLQGMRPGTLAVWVSEDGVEFAIHPVGFDEKRDVSPLEDEQGEPIVLTGAFNPNLKAPQAPEVKLNVPQPWEQPQK